MTIYRLPDGRWWRIETSRCGVNVTDGAGELRAPVGAKDGHEGASIPLRVAASCAHRDTNTNERRGNG